MSEVSDRGEEREVSKRGEVSVSKRIVDWTGLD